MAADIKDGTVVFKAVSQAASSVRGPESTDLPFGPMVAVFLIFGSVAMIAKDALAIDPMRLLLVPLGSPVPEFSLPGIQDETPSLSSTDLQGKVSVVNVFASWCAPCRQEHPLLMKLADQNVVPVYGLNYKDAPDGARLWLERLGNPYARIGSDRDGSVAEAWELYALPQTIVVDKTGRTAFVHSGALDEIVLKETILPLVSTLSAEAVTP